METLPGPLAEIADVAVHDFDPQTDQEQEIIDSEGRHFAARVWFDILDTKTATPLATYGKGYYAGKTAVTENSFGKGTVLYVGT
jgi:beta-galactosidase